MPLKPINFTTPADIEESLKRLGNGLDYLLISADGNTYLYSEINRLMPSDVCEIEIMFLAKDGTLHSVSDIQQNGVDGLLSNKPLTSALATLRVDEHGLRVDIPGKTTLTPFPAILPVITNEERTEEHFFAERFNRRSGHTAYTVLVPNVALDQLFTAAVKTVAQLDDYLLGLFAIRQHPDLAAIEQEYQRIVAQYPGWVGQSEEAIQANTERYARRSHALATVATSAFLGIGIMGNLGLLIPLGVGSFEGMLNLSQGVLNHTDRKVASRRAAACALSNYRSNHVLFAPMLERYKTKNADLAATLSSSKSSAVI